ncbi:XTP/dITP diphosphatase [Desulfococcaceae bacterium HSG7]|nr:XTP/dITP diphosphatase [Desulfococcaceae bacterium HSG7]
MIKSTMIVLATRNKGKIAEISALLEDRDTINPVTLKNLDDFGPMPDVEEDGNTFDENAYKKAGFYARILGLPCLADDSGLTVAALDGAPGVLSARYAGENATDEERCTKLLRAMEGQSDRQAAFECVLSFAVPTGQALTYEARCEGVITERPIGANGFGYDPLFYYPPLKKTFAQLTREEKSRVSHRGQALNEFKNEFDKVLVWLQRLTPA